MNGSGRRVVATASEWCLRPAQPSGPHSPRSKTLFPVKKQVNIVYKVSCSCGKVYIRETKRFLETRLKEHREAGIRGQTSKSAIAEHAWTEGHPINWDGTRILQRASHTMELLMKEVMCIQSMPADSRFN